MRLVNVLYVLMFRFRDLARPAEQKPGNIQRPLRGIGLVIANDARATADVMYNTYCRGKHQHLIQYGNPVKGNIGPESRCDYF